MTRVIRTQSVLAIARASSRTLLCLAAVASGDCPWSVLADCLADDGLVVAEQHARKAGSGDRRYWQVRQPDVCLRKVARAIIRSLDGAKPVR